MKLFVENLTNIDFSYLHPHRGLLGESWLVQLELDGSLNPQGMICDFGIVKKAVKQWFDQWIDHALVVPTGMPRLSYQSDKQYTEIEWLYPEGEKLRCRSPQQAITLVSAPEITEHTLAEWCREKLLELFPEEVKGLSVSFVPESIRNEFYHYSHGLQLHDGNCQRIAHGHRSTLAIYLDDQRQPELEQQWAERFRDIYIGTRSHLVKQSEGIDYYAYNAPQGEFELSLPSRCCYLIDEESTVEHIALHLAQQIKRDHQQNEVVVKAFEGVGKGAIAQL